jgi:pyruvate-ferredoxin/flavodoxin oxidoreductase
MLIANATGCSSIYGGNLPTTPYTTNEKGLGPAWSNSLFEDNAEFGLGFRLSVDRKTQEARELVKKMEGVVGGELVSALLEADQSDEAAIFEQRERVAQLKSILEKDGGSDAKLLLSLADYLVKKSVWIIGGDGWAYDIGFGGLDHALASGKNINILVMDTEVYSNTGGQASKATPISAVAKFAANGKLLGKKDLAWQAMGYGDVYVAKVAFGANDTHTIKAFLEAESYDGPSIIIAYSHCIAHGYDLKYGLDQQKKAVDSGVWELYRYDPRLAKEGKNPFMLDSKAPKIPVSEYTKGENRFRMLTKIDGTRATMLSENLQEFVTANWDKYSKIAKLDYSKDDE